LDLLDIEKLACDSLFRNPNDINSKPSRKSLAVAIKRLEHCIAILKDMKRKEFPPEALQEVAAFLSDIKNAQDKVYAKYLKKFDLVGSDGLNEHIATTCPVEAPENYDSVTEM
jgi:hypothetical protein